MCAIVWMGVRKGVERLARIAMPVFFLLLLALAVRSLTFPGAAEGLIWYLRPDFSALDGEAVLTALGQSFFSIGIGMAAAFGFGSYLDPSDSDVPGGASLIVALDTLVAFIAGLVLFPALFVFGLEPDSGPGLLFVTTANLFSRMPAGQVFAVAFFFLLLLAGVTSAVAQIEVLVATLVDCSGIERRYCVIITGVGLMALNVPVVLSQGRWSVVTAFGMDLFVLTDYFSGSVLLPLGAIAPGALRGRLLDMEGVSRRREPRGRRDPRGRELEALRYGHHPRRSCCHFPCRPGASPSVASACYPLSLWTTSFARRNRT